MISKISSSAPADTQYSKVGTRVQWLVWTFSNSWWGMSWVLNIGGINIVSSWRGRRRSLPSAGTRWRWRDSCSDLWEANWCQFHMISGKDSQCWKRLLGTVAAAAFCERLWCSMLGLSALKYGISTPFHLAHPTDSGWTTWEITEICVLCIEKQQVGGWSFRSQTKLKIQPEIASGKSIHVVQGY